MALSVMLILEIVIVFSFAVTSLFMFVPKKNETVHKIFFALAIMLGILVTVVNATSFPSNLVNHIIIAWLCLIPSALAVIIAVANGKPNVPAKLLAMLTSILGAVGYFLL